MHKTRESRGFPFVYIAEDGKMKEFLECGKVVAPHGLRGEVKVLPWCDGPQFFGQVGRVFLQPAGGQALEIERARSQNTVAIVKFAGCDTVEQAAAMKNRVLFAARGDIPLQEGEYFVQDLEGLSVYDADTGALYGRLTQVSQTGANDVYHIAFADGKERLIPAIRQVVVGVDLEKGRMDIRPLKGLFDDED